MGYCHLEHSAPPNFHTPLFMASPENQCFPNFPEFGNIITDSFFNVYKVLICHLKGLSLLYKVSG